MWYGGRLISQHLTTIMKIHYDTELIEWTYLEAHVRNDPKRDQLYSIEDPQQRDEAFTRHHTEWFHQQGYETTIRMAFGEYPLICDNCRETVIRRVRHPSDQFAELFRNHEGWNRIGVGLRESLVISDRLEDFFLHELCHINDMLDPDFGYPSEIPRDPSATGEIRRERYRLLWDLFIDGRLARKYPAKSVFGNNFQCHSKLFSATFSFLPGVEKDHWLALLAAGDAITHGQLWSLASDPRHVRDANQARLPGAACPLCGFTTFAWADDVGVHQASSGIQMDYLDWSEAQGCCQRCAEVYSAVVATRYPPTVLLPSRSRRDRIDNTPSCWQRQTASMPS